MARVFFVPPFADDDPATEPAYRKLRDQAEDRMGAVSRERRIEGVICRVRGRDCTLRVGEPDPANGRLVAAIIQLGRDAYTVHHLGADPAQLSDPLVLRQSEVYSITDFR